MGASQWASLAGASTLRVMHDGCVPAPGRIIYACAQNITVTAKATTPVFSPAGGTYSSTQSVTTDSTPGATIYYTTDGSTPTTSLTKYTGAISVSATETTTVIATATGYSQSAVASVVYTIESTPTVYNVATSFASGTSLRQTPTAFGPMAIRLDSPARSPSTMSPRRMK
jgi:hypothetical protein